MRKPATSSLAIRTARSPTRRPSTETRWTSTYGKLPGPNVIRTHAYVAFWETAMLIVAETDAMADCPRSLAVRYAARLGLQVLDPPFRPFRFTVQAVRRANQPDPGLDWLMTRLAAAVEAKH